ncbi:MAG: hypothetical protein K2N12_05170 [Helicobacter sp.]|nr:hypothetical protein [Helicobacter sp.]
MTKNLTKIFMSAALFAGIATADTDLFAKLSNGAMSDKDAGIAELSREQKAKVVGGYITHKTSKFNYRDGGVIYPYSYQTGMIVQPETAQEYNLFHNIVNFATEDIVMLTRYNYNPAGYNYQFVIADRASGKIKRNMWGAGAADMLQKVGVEGRLHNESVRFPYR